ncbi:MULTISPECIES: phosphoribosyltransferase domain-containing protein [unclassified Arthrobacter]|uniref:phosphoribosyltransferase domain-containing protein n=1 Tax=unclassified Arthrobacter TaxID=235627 RepID=UPI001E6387EA|nr:MULTISPECIES: phosphoribosyltransferase domain-containing protein [unclassified Arthrobacter]MCC9145951.1 phosphoribosyltransferase [Arthrobacter sp. zg-Y919]MDK1277180.1 phosphoribosyltransferase domain-containing protein [Arthrobacter sp. zg.Y919]WIB03694.1 phosphoribosyltransferase domain-containing protein [Arthrobacter sp. zg-Y919]
MNQHPWTGGFVHEALGVRITSDPAALLPVEDLVGLALRRNPRRAHLLVSRVLAKHVPTEPAVVLAAGELLGALAGAALGSTVDDAVLRGAAAELAAALEDGTAPADDDGGPGTSAGRDSAGRARSAAARSPRTRLQHAREQLWDLPISHPDVVTVGYAETATGLGRLVADVLGSYYIHSTRHAPADAVAYGSFEEAHSHATSHRLLPVDPALLNSPAPVVLVDDELSTGATVINTITELHAAAPHPLYVVASLIDLRSDADRARFDELAQQLGCSIRVVALSTGRIDLGEDLLARAQGLIGGLPDQVEATEFGPGVVDPAPVTVLDYSDAARGLRSDRFGNRAGVSSEYLGTLPAALPGAVSAESLALIASRISASLPDPAEPVLVLGCEEFIHVPLTIANALAEALPGVPVRFSTTTRSPIVPIDRSDYAIANAVAFASHDVTEDGPGPRHAYNVGARRTGAGLDTVGAAGPDAVGADRTAGADGTAAGAAGTGFGSIVLLPEPGTDLASITGPGSVTEALRAVTGAVVVVLLPADVPTPEDWTGPAAVPAAVPLTGPEFGSYAPEDVTWLLKDLRDAALEAPTAEREAAIQSGGANYAESLPMEYLPSAQYQDLYEEALRRSAPRVAAAVGTVTELALAARNREPVLVSLARAGTPIGILMRRWAQRMHGLDLPHYTMSIVRGVGMDETALRYLARTYASERILFVDGWTGKGAITRELTAALEKFEASDGVRFSSELAVLADPGHSVELFGTREDYLIPSACLNSTVSGLVSRTVFNKDLIAPHDFHGAKFYSHLATADVSRDFLTAIESHFDDVRPEAEAAAASLVHADRTPTWVGWQAVERLSEEYGIHNVNLVKPGVGETTRVLLRRVPWKVLVHPDALEDVAHVLLLAEQRGVPVEEVPDLPFSCVGLIHPRFTAGAVGADGRAVAGAGVPGADA